MITKHALPLIVLLFSLPLLAQEGGEARPACLLETEPARYSGGILRDYCDFLRDAPGHETLSLPLSLCGVAARGPALWQDKELGGECAPIGYVRSFTAWNLNPAFAVVVLDDAKPVNPFRGRVWAPHELVTSGAIDKLKGEPANLSASARTTMPTPDSVLSEIELANPSPTALRISLAAFGAHEGFAGSPAYMCRDPKVPRHMRVDPARSLAESSDTFVDLPTRKQVTFYSCWVLSRPVPQGLACQGTPREALTQMLLHSAVGPSEATLADNSQPVSFALLLPGDLSPGETLKFKVALGLSTTSAEEARTRAEAALARDYSAAAAEVQGLWNALLSNGPQPEGDDPLAQLYYSCTQTLFQATVPGDAPGFASASLIPDAKYNYIGYWQWDEIMAIIGMRFVYPAFVDSILENQFAVSGASAGQCTNTAWQIWKTYELTGDKDFLARFYDRAVAQVEGTMRQYDADGDNLRRASSGLIGESDEITRRSTPDSRSVVGVGDSACVSRDYRSLAAIARVLGRASDAEAFDAGADAIRTAANLKLWDPARGIYLVRDETKDERIDILAADAFVAFFGGFPDNEQTGALLKHLFNADEFWTEAPIPTIALNDPHFANRWWDGGVWMYLNHPVIEGLRVQGLRGESRALRERTFAALFKHGPQEAWGPHNDWVRGWAYTETAGHAVDLILSRVGVRTDDGKLSFEDIELPARSVRNLIFHGTRFDVIMNGESSTGVATPSFLTIDGERVEGCAVPEHFCDGGAHRIKMELRVSDTRSNPQPRRAPAPSHSP
ncbi:MAG: trehalase family glycosidase [Planctomycetota bacterium]